ncbi:MAG: hypothetical protein ACLP56_16685 [Candidatus Sulfotelmatobacter sp.]
MERFQDLQPHMVAVRKAILHDPASQVNANEFSAFLRPETFLVDIAGTKGAVQFDKNRASLAIKIGPAYFHTPEDF